MEAPCLLGTASLNASRARSNRNLKSRPLPPPSTHHLRPRHDRPQRLRRPHRRQITRRLEKLFEFGGYRMKKAAIPSHASATAIEPFIFVLNGSSAKNQISTRQTEAIPAVHRLTFNRTRVHSAQAKATSRRSGTTRKPHVFSLSSETERQRRQAHCPTGEAKAPDDSNQPFSQLLGGQLAPAHH